MAEAPRLIFGETLTIALDDAAFMIVRATSKMSAKWTPRMQAFKERYMGYIKAEAQRKPR